VHKYIHTCVMNAYSVFSDHNIHRLKFTDQLTTVWLDTADVLANVCGPKLVGRFMISQTCILSYC